MSGYNIFLDRTKHDVLNMILDNIKKGSTVLEFGCANGRMTRYLSEELECRVDIIEYDEELFQIAREYAEYGICTDILQFDWKKQLVEKKYDYIIFADVLEHLSDPKRVLLECKSLLKENGVIWISVPNIAHNDIIISLMDNVFNYTETGLLDRTHIHFFTNKSAQTMFNEAGFRVVYEDASYKQTFCTEQLLAENYQWKDNFAEMLKKNEGEVYQWLFAITCGDINEHYIKNYNYYNKERNFYERRIYVNDGNGYRQHSISREKIRENQLKIDIELDGNTEMVWVQPAFKKFFLIDDLEILVDEKKVLYCHFDGEHIENRHIITNTNGGIYIDSLKGKQRVEIKGTISFDVSELTILKKKENEIKNELRNKEVFKEEVQRLNGVILQVNKEKEDCIEEVQRLNGVILQVNKEKEDCIEEIQRLNDVILQVNKEKEDCIEEIQRLNDVILQVNKEKEDCIEEIQRLNDVILQVNKKKKGYRG